MLGLVLCGLGMFRAPGQAQVLGGGSPGCHSGGDGRAGARARSASPAGRRRAAERRHRRSRRHGWSRGRGACRGRFRASSLAAAVAAGAMGGLGPSPTFQILRRPHAPTSTNYPSPSRRFLPATFPRSGSNYSFDGWTQLVFWESAHLRGEGDM
eukprot:4498280-Prymnesium_polylepis.1